MDYKLLTKEQRLAILAQAIQTDEESHYRQTVAGGAVQPHGGALPESIQQQVKALEERIEKLHKEYDALQADEKPKK